jgi:predicted amidohydrolase YtcJ
MKSRLLLTFIIVLGLIFKIDPKDIETTNVVMTILDGRVIYEGRE